MSNPADPNAFVGPLAEIEAHVRAAEERGEALPAEAYALLAKLRELVAALRDLDSTLGPPPPPPPPDKEP